jgi:hypothetical protein
MKLFVLFSGYDRHSIVQEIRRRANHNVGPSATSTTTAAAEVYSGTLAPLRRCVLLRRIHVLYTGSVTAAAIK